MKKNLFSSKILSFLVFVPAILLGCSTKSSIRPIDKSSCIEVQITSEIRFSGGGTFWGDNLSATISPDLEGGGYDRFSIRLRNSETGVFDLSRPPDNLYSTCERCVMIMENVWGDNVNVLNFQVEGEMTIEAIDRETGQSRGSVRDVYLREIKPTGLHTWGGFTDNTACYHIPNAAWDTFAGEGYTCNTSGDCINHKIQVCDPGALQCVLSQCDDNNACSGDDICILQHGAYKTGACYSACMPFVNGGCPEGLDCVSVNYAGDMGVCLMEGETAVGEECVSTTSGTDCEPGAICQTLVPFWGKTSCYRRCDFFSDDPGCDDHRLCSLKLYRDKDWQHYCANGKCYMGGTCREIEYDGARVGELCDSEPETFCGIENGVARGICLEENGLWCRRVCRLGYNDCSGCTHLIAAEKTEIEGLGYCP